MDKLPTIFKSRTNLILIGVLILIIISSFLGFKKFFIRPTSTAVLDEVDLPFDPEGPYALLYPRRDGNALVLNIKRVSSYDAISYDLAYQSQGIDRGVHGDIKKLGSTEGKAEYSQEILFGTCSQGFTSGGAHCVFDKDVENGTLTLHIQKDQKAYRMITTWHLQLPDVALGNLTSGDGHFNYKTEASKDELNLVGYSIINDLSGVPKLPSGKVVSGKVYALEVPQAKTLPKGQVSLELADKTNGSLYEYEDSKNDWVPLVTKTGSSSATLVANGDGTGIFAVLVNSSSK